MTQQPKRIMAKVKDNRNNPRAHYRHVEAEICVILGRMPYDATVNKLMVVIMKQRIKEVEHCYKQFSVCVSPSAREGMAKGA